MSDTKALYLPEDIRPYLAHKVKEGEYSSVEEALIGTVKKQMDYELALMHERREVQKGIDSADAGRFSDRSALDVAAAARRAFEEK